MKIYQWFVALIYIVVLAIGWKYPLVGLLVIPMIGLGMVMAPVNGRWACGNLCPRGMFLDKVFKKISSSKDIPKLFMQPIFRWTFLIIFMTKMSFTMFDMYQTGFTVDALAGTFWWSMFVTTIIALLGGFFYNERFWCAICPVGTIGKAAKGIAPKNYTVDEACKSCGACQRACPFGHNPAEFKGAEFDNSDCMKCGRCISACKFDAIKK